MPWMFIANPEQPLHPHQPTFLRQVNPSRSVADGRRAQIKSLRRPSQSHCPSPRGGFLHRHARRSGRDCTLLRWRSASRPDTCGGAATWEHKRGENKSTRHGGLHSSEQKARKQFRTRQVFKRWTLHCGWGWGTNKTLKMMRCHDFFSDYYLLQNTPCTAASQNLVHEPHFHEEGALISKKLRN